VRASTEGYSNAVVRHQMNIQNDDLQVRSDARDPVDAKIAETREKQVCLRKRQDEAVQREI
jgi:hypothetical protein